MKLSELLSALIDKSQYKQNSLEEELVLGKNFINHSVKAKTGVVQKLDKAFQALTPDITIEEFIAAIDLINEIKRRNKDE